MKDVKTLFKLFLLMFFIQCNQKGSSENCITREWKVIDVYRNNYPPLIDTSCTNNLILYNKFQIKKVLIDSFFQKNETNNLLISDSSGTYELIANSTIEYEGSKYQVDKIDYLPRGANIDQGILLWIVNGRGIYIQQERDERKLFLLNKLQYENGDTVSTRIFIEKMMADTVLFPPPPPLPPGK